MVSLPEDAPSRDAQLPGFIEYLPAALRVLRRSIDDLLEYFWDERYRNRACEQAYALAHASKLEGRIRLFTISRTIATICFLSQEEAMPIRRELSEKLRELVSMLEDACSESHGEQAG
jgi:hypothetical protein